MRNIWIILGILMLTSVYSTPEAVAQGAEFRIISADELKAEMDAGKKLYIIDARGAEEYGQGHLPGAVSIPPESFNYMAGLLPNTKSYPIVFYCRGWG